MTDAKEPTKGLYEFFENNPEEADKKFSAEKLMPIEEAF